MFLKITSKSAECYDATSPPKCLFSVFLYMHDFSFCHLITADNKVFDSTSKRKCKITNSQIYSRGKCNSLCANLDFIKVFMCLIILSLFHIAVDDFKDRNGHNIYLEMLIK